MSHFDYASRRRAWRDGAVRPCSLLLLAAIVAWDVPLRPAHAGTVEPTLGTRGALLLGEKFDRQALRSGKVRVTDGVLRTGRSKDVDRLCLFNVDQPIRDAPIRVDFRFDGAGGINVSMNPSPGELNKKGHLFSVMITQRSWNVTEHNDKSDLRAPPRGAVSLRERLLCMPGSRVDQPGKQRRISLRRRPGRQQTLYYRFGSPKNGRTCA